VIGRNDWREYDQIVSLYTLELGRIEVLARGVKKILSKNSAFLELGNLIEAEIIPGKELNHLGSVQVIKDFFDLRKIVVGNTVLVSSLHILSSFVTHQEKDERIFKLVYSWLDFLNNEETPLNIFLLDIFVVKLLAALGFDISTMEKAEKETHYKLEVLVGAGWGTIGRLKFEEKESKILHNIIYQFCLYYSTSKINDWAKLAYFNKIY
jgi:DNA repair protein RecO